MKTLLIATRNLHKGAEIQALLGAGVRCLTLASIPAAPQLVEDADNFAGNAARKAAQLAGWIRHHAVGQASSEARPRFILADDSGLEVDALNGAPGVYSARFAALDAAVGANCSDADNNAKLLRLLAGIPAGQRTARFRCVLALVSVDASPSDQAPRLFEGSCEGQISFAPSGSKGFGYDPLFIPSGHARSFAELGEEVKNRISHRAKALTLLRGWLNEQEEGSGAPRI